MLVKCNPVGAGQKSKRRDKPQEDLLRAFTRTLPKWRAIEVRIEKRLEKHEWRKEKREHAPLGNLHG
jgi:hypothetical protein